MKAQVRAGDPAAALRHAQAYEKRLREEFGLAPDGRILALVEAIRRTPTAAVDARLSLPSHPPVASARTAPAAPAPVSAADQPVALAPPTRARHLVWLAGMGILLLGALLLFRGVRQSSGYSAPAPARTAIAVLPFQNLSNDSSHAYFAGGLHDELLTQLSKVAGLTVTSGQSVLGYAGRNPPLRQIAHELGVGSVVEASVQVVGKRLRVTVQLIDATTDAHLWAEHYDRTLDDAFAIQSEVARQIVGAVGAAISDAEARALGAPYTTNPEAYRLYLQGHEYFARPMKLQPDLDIAQHFFEQAITLDPRFALAHAALAGVHGLNYLLRYDRSPLRAGQQHDEAEAALRLAPDLPQGHLALAGWYYQSKGDYPRALAELRIALQGLPSDVEVWARIGQVTRRMGHWSESLAAHQKTTVLDPRGAAYFKELGVTYLEMRRYPEAIAAFDRALSLAPDVHFPRQLQGEAYLRWQGQLDSLSAAVGSVPWSAQSSDWTMNTLGLTYFKRQTDSMTRLARAIPRGVAEGQTTFLPASLYTGWALQLDHDPRAARRAFESAVGFLDSAVRAHPDDERIHEALGLALAGLGHRAEALREASWLQQSVPYRNDKFQGTVVMEARAWILAQAGEADAALDEIETLLARPSQLSGRTLQLNPLWDPIRTQPRFRALAAK